uniref:DUF4250 domain-containing protein n=1 Tax=Thaumasiovibrio occultus TaxID=1891184 RepID=UPI000B3546F9|nr:DUF4250 domain-containing protein [Thaumasiovibrio occultus]
MDIRNYQNMDPIMLMSIINMKLRDEYGDLDNLVKSMDLDKDALVAKLKAAGFDYLEDVKQFR